MFRFRPTRGTPITPTAAGVTPRGRLATLALTFMLAACGAESRSGAREPGNVDSTRAAAATTASAESPASPTDAAGDPATVVRVLVGRLLHEIVPDSSLHASWAVSSVERHVGIRHVVLGGSHYLLADTLVGYEGPTALWRLRQAQPIPAPAPGEGYIASCALPKADAADGTVVARVTRSAGESLSPVHAAWRLDPASWSFAAFPTDSLSCYNEGSGP